MKNNKIQSTDNNSNSFLINFFPKFLYLGIFAILCVPFVVFFQVFYPYTVPKGLWIQTINWILLAVYLIGIVTNKELYYRYKPKLNFIFYLYVIYVFISFLSSFLGDNFRFSFFGEFQRMTGLYWQLHTVIFLFILSACSNMKKFYYNLFSFLFFIGLIFSIFYILEHHDIFSFDMPGYSDQARAVFTIGNPGFVGLYMMSVFLIGFGLFSFNFANIHFSFLKMDNMQDKSKYYIYYFYLLLTMFLLLYATILTASRSVIPGLLSGMTMFIILLFLSYRSQIRLRQLIISISLIIFVFFILSFIFFITGILDTSIDRFVHIFNSQREGGDMGLSSRLSNANVVLRAFTEKPLFGFGINNFMIPYNKYVIPSQITTFEMDNAHSLFLNILTTTGLMGLFAYLTLMLSILFNAIKNGRFIFNDEEYGLSGIIFIVPIFFAGYFIHQLFWFDFHEVYILIMIMISLMNVSIKTPVVFTKNLGKFKQFIIIVFGSMINKNARFVSVLIFGLIFIIFLNVEIKMYQTTSDIWNYSQITYSDSKDKGYIQSKVEQMLVAVNRYPPMSNEARTFIVNDAIRLAPDLNEPSRSQLLNVAFTEGHNAIHKHPTYWKLHARLAILYFEIAQISENNDQIEEYKKFAEQLFNNSIILGPSRYDLYKALFNLHMHFDEYDKADGVLQKYKNYLISMNLDLDSNYYHMNAMINYENCTNNLKDYLVIKKCIQEIK